MHYVFGAYSLDTQRYELHHAGAPVPLRPKVFQVLAYLVAQQARVVSKEELLQALWPGQFVGDEGLNSYIMAVRKALGDRATPHQFIRTVRGHGYRFVAPIEVRDQTLSITTLPMAPALMAEASVPAPTPLLPPVPSPVMAYPAASAAPRSEGEYKPVSVLCSGLHDAPTLAAALGPEGLYRVMQTVVALAHEVIQSYGGTMTHQAPEGFTAVFGAPVAQEDHARRAGLAALDLQQRLRQPLTLRTPALGAGLAVSMGVARRKGAETVVASRCPG